MTTSNLIVSNFQSSIKYKSSSTQTVPSIPEHTLVRSFGLMVCILQDQTTKSLKQGLASNFMAFSYGKDAYLLELTSSIGGQE